VVSCAKADDYNTAVVGHVITQKVQGNNVDMSVFEAELQKMFAIFALQVADHMEKNLPMIMETITAQLRQEIDSKHKCLLLKDSKITDKECS
jgi:hypothetical protein